MEGDTMNVDSLRPDSGQSLVRDGILTSAGQNEDAAAMDLSDDSDVLVEADARPTNRRPLPADASQRLAISWVASAQGCRGRAATCRCCNKVFSRGELRIAKESDFVSSSGRHFHLSCLPGGLHAHDSVQGEPTRDPQVMASIEAFRAPVLDDGPSAEVARHDRASYVGTAASDLQRGFAFWGSWDWTDTFRHVFRTLIEVPKTLQSAFAERKQNIISEILKIPHDDPGAVPMWRCLSMFDALVLNSNRQTEESQCDVVSRRLQQVDDGDWASLWQESVGLLMPISQRDRPAMQRKKRASLVQKLATSGEHARAIRAMQEPSEIMRDSSRLAEVKALYPPRSPMTLVGRSDAQVWNDEEYETLAKRVSQSLRRAPVRTAPGPLGSRLEHWTVLKFAAGGLREAGQLLARLALGRVPSEMIEVHGRGEIMPAIKDNGGLRPILISSVLRRIALKVVARESREAVQQFAGDMQLCFAKDGITKAHHSISSLARKDQDRALLSLDVANAHQSFSRSEADSAIAQACPELQLPWRCWYARTSNHFWRSNDGGLHDISSTAGADQGCALANLAYCSSVMSPLRRAHEAISRLDAGARIFLFSDDIKVWVAPEHMEAAYKMIEEALREVGLSLSPTKTKVWAPTTLQLPVRFRAFRVLSLECLGARLIDEGQPSDPVLPSIGGEVPPVLEAAATRVNAFAVQAEDLCGEGLSIQIAQALFRYVSHGVAQHIISSAYISEASVQSYDVRLRSAWERVLGLKLSDEAWRRAQLPLKEGGLATGALGGLVPRAATAFLAAWSRSSDYVAQVMRYQSISELLVDDQILAGELQSAADSLKLAGMQASQTPWHNHEVPSPFKQSQVLKKISAMARTQAISVLAQPMAAQWRSSSGPGSSGYLLVPADEGLLMDNLLFQLSVARRFGGGIRLTDDNAGPPLCALCSPTRRCTELLDVHGHHATTCNRGGCPVRRHNRLVRWLAAWLQDGRVDSEVHLEQSIVQDPPGRMDVVVGYGAAQVWIDIAVVSPTSTCQRTLQTRAAKDGHAARTEEQVKRRRYGTRVSPFVLESGGRPGPSARTILMTFASPDVSTSIEVGTAWLAVSSIIQSETSLAMLKAWGGSSALTSGRAAIFVP